MGGSSSKDSSSDNNEKLQERMRRIIEDETRKKNASREEQAANDARIKNLMRDVLKEEGNRKTSSSSETAKHNAMLMGVLTEILQSRGTNKDKSKMINYLLDMQQNIGRSANKASGDIAKFIEKQLLELQSGVAQDLKITVEKKASGTSRQPNNIDEAVEARPGPSNGGYRTHSHTMPVTSTVVTPRKPQAPVPPTQSYTNVREEAKPPHKNFPNPQSTRKDYNREFEDLFSGSEEFDDLLTDSKAPQENLRHVAPTFKDNRPNQNSFNGGKPNQQDYHKVAPPASYFPDPLLNNNNFSSYGQNPEKVSSTSNKNQPFQEKQLPNKMPFKPNIPQHSFPSNIEKNQQKQFQGNEAFKKGKEEYDNGPFLDRGPPLLKNNDFFKNRKDGYDNGPFLDRGPPLLKNKDEGSMVDRDYDGNFFVKVPPPLMSVFDNTGKYPNNGQNQGRAGRYRGNNQHRGPRRATDQRYGPDPRNSQSPHRNQDRFQQDRNNGLLPFPPPTDGYFSGPNSELYHGPNIGNNRGAFQYRGDGARRPFPNRGKEFSQGRAQHFQNQGRGGFVRGPGPDNENSWEFGCDGRQEQSMPGNHHPRMPRSDRGNNLNQHPRMPRSDRGNNSDHHPRSYSQPRARHSDQTQENAGGQEAGGKQGNKGPRGSYRGQGAFPRPRYYKGRGGGAIYKKQQQGAWSAETEENKCDDSDDSVKTDISTKSSPSTAMVEAAGEEKKKKKKKNRSKAKNKLKNASSATNLTTSQNNSGEDTQSHSDTVEGVSSVEKDESSDPLESSAPLENAAPLELMVGSLDNETLETLSPDEVLGHAIVVIARVDDGVRSYHPTTVGELLALKKKYPTAKVIFAK